MNSLIGVIFKNSKRRDNKNKISKREIFLNAISFIIVFGFLALIMGIISIYVTIKLSEIEQTYAFINILLLLNFILLFAKSIFESLNVLYFSKDLKVLLRLPLKSKDILNAKLINMIVSEYEMEIIMLAIPMIVYGIYTNVSLIFYLYMIIILIILPVIPILITSFIIAIIMRFTNSIKNKNKAMYITIFISIFLVGIITSFFETNSYLSISSFEDMILTANGLSEYIVNSFMLIKPIMNTLLNYDNVIGFQDLIIYIIESVICYKIIVFLMSKIYLKGAVGTTINSSKRKFIINNELTLKDFKKKNKNISYLKKELKILSRTPIFLLQCIIMPIIYPILVFLIMAGFISFANSVGVDALSEFYNRLLEVSGTAIFICIGQVFYMMNFCSIIAVSKESKNSIIIKYIPVKLKTQFNIKISLGILLNMISVFLVSVVYYICTKNLLNTVILFIVLIFVNIICEKVKILIDLKRPQISWDNEYTMMKQNTNVLYELFYTLIVIGIAMLITIFIKNILLYLIFALFLCIIINALINEFLYQKQDYIFRKIF